MKLISIFQILMAVPFKQNTSPSCKDCLFYKPFPISDPFNRRDQCTRFVQRDATTGSLTFESVSLCRNHDLKCGPKGSYFFPKKASQDDEDDELCSEYDYEVISQKKE